MKKSLCPLVITALLLSCTHAPEQLPRAEATGVLDSAFCDFINAVNENSIELHSIMVFQHGKVLEECSFAPDTAHAMFSVSKTFTSVAVGFAIDEGVISLEDRIVDLFKDHLPLDYSPKFENITIRHLLTMSCGHGQDPTKQIIDNDGDWIRSFMGWPIEFEPGSCFCYNSLSTYLLSAAVQKATGQKIADYLEPRLWMPLGIDKPYWQESPQGINSGGWGLFLHTEDMARFGLCLLNNGNFYGKQVIPEWWVKEMTKKQIDSSPSHFNRKEAEAILDNQHDSLHEYFTKAAGDWLLGYGYQMWLCRDGAVRADGSKGQYIIVIPNKDAVIVTTSYTDNMALELKLIWDYIIPAL